MEKKLIKTKKEYKKFIENQKKHYLILNEPTPKEYPVLVLFNTGYFGFDIQKLNLYFTYLGDFK